MAATRAQQQTLLRVNSIVTGLAVVVGLLYSFVLTLGLVRPMHKLMEDMRRVGGGDLDVAVEVTSNDEIGELAESFGGMVDELILTDKIKSTFGKCVDPRVVENLMDGDDSLETGGAKEEMTVVFTEFDFHSLQVDALAPVDLVRLINDCLTALSTPVTKHKGVIDKYIDSMVMSFWGPPFNAESAHATMACKAVLEQLRTVDDLHKRLQSDFEEAVDVSSLNIYVGVSTGPVVVGNMGSQQSMSYTVLGDTVNIASRLKGACKIYGVCCLIVEETRSMIADEM